MCHFKYFFTSYTSLMFLSVMLGLFGGVRQSLGTLLTIQFMGTDKFLKTIGMQSMFGIASLALHNPLLSECIISMCPGRPLLSMW